MSMPAKISTAPTLSRGVSVSPSISQEKNEPNTGSPENMRAARVAEVYLWAVACINMVTAEARMPQ